MIRTRGAEEVVDKYIPLSANSSATSEWKEADINLTGRPSPPQKIAGVSAAPIVRWLANRQQHTKRLMYMSFPVFSSSPKIDR